MSLRKSATRKKYITLIEQSLNQAISDGFKPYDPAAPDHPESAALEVERRLGLSAGLVARALKDNEIVQNCSLYNEKEPHQELFLALRRAGIEITSDDKSRRNLLRLNDDVRRLKKTISTLDREQLSLNEIRTKVYKLPSYVPIVPEWVVETHTKTGSPGIPVTLWSDWHYGETVELAAMSGKNAFNMEIADIRIAHLVDRIIDICLHHQVKPDYPGIVVCLGGDMFSGDGLHEELTDTNEAKTIALFMRLQGRMIWAIEKLADAFGHVYVPCDFGNHARNTVTPRYKLRAETNYEYLLYNQLEFYFHNNPRYASKVDFNVSQGAGVHFTIGKNKKIGNPGHRYFLIHGDLMGVKGGDGIIGAIGPIKRGRIKIGDSEESIGHDFDTLLLGHWHQYIPIQGIVVNGTLKGWCDYARYGLRAPYSPPSQSLWFNHPFHGPVTHHKIILENGFLDPKLKHSSEAFSPQGTGGPKGRKKTDGSLKLAA